MTCEPYKKIFNKYMEGTLDQQSLEDLQQHIETCPECQAEQKGFSLMQEILDDAMNPSDTCKDKISLAISNLTI